MNKSARYTPTTLTTHTYIYIYISLYTTTAHYTHIHTFAVSQCLLQVPDIFQSRIEAEPEIGLDRVYGVAEQDSRRAPVYGIWV